MKRLLSALPVAGVLALSACGSSDPESTPTSCLDGSRAYLTALEAAPEQVMLDGSVPISDCLVPDQPSGALADVGSSVVSAATTLNKQAQSRPASEATVELGYLVGSVERGAEDTQGVHADLVRRINTAARFRRDGELPGIAFERNFGAGYAVGRESG